MAGLTTILADVRYPLLWAFGGLCALLFYLRHRRRVRTFLLGAVTGLLSLVLLHLDILPGALGSLAGLRLR